MDEVTSLLDRLPTEITEHLHKDDLEDLVEIIIDEGRLVEFRFLDDTFDEIQECQVTREMLDKIEAGLGVFGPDNRAGIDYSLHRISRMLNRTGQTVGLTCRVGRPVTGCVALIEDLVKSGKNILLLGKPGTGKTTKLRDVARLLSTEMFHRVIVIDTSNEIAGDGNLAHPAIGRSRRMQVPIGKKQHEIMEEAVENHMPECIIIDEISNAIEAASARTISQRGIQLIATAHGLEINELIANPELCDLVGGNKTVQIGDRLMNQRGLSTKTVHERQHTPIFDTVVELVGFDEVVIHHSVAEAVDAIMLGGIAQGEKRRLVDGQVMKLMDAKITRPRAEPEPSNPTSSEDDFRQIRHRFHERPATGRDTKEKPRFKGRDRDDRRPKRRR